MSLHQAYLMPTTVVQCDSYRSSAGFFWISSHMPSKVLGEFAYPFRNFNSTAAWIRERMSNFIPHFVMDTITLPCWNQSKSMLPVTFKQSYKQHVFENVVIHLNSPQLLKPPGNATFAINIKYFLRSFRVLINFCTPSFCRTTIPN